MEEDENFDLDIALRKIHEWSLEDGDLGRDYWYRVGKLLNEAAGMRAEINALSKELECYRAKQ